jgi:hypothetical protein
VRLHHDLSLELIHWTDISVTVVLIIFSFHYTSPSYASTSMFTTCHFIFRPMSLLQVSHIVGSGYIYSQEDKYRNHSLDNLSESTSSTTNLPFSTHISLICVLHQLPKQSCCSDSEWLELYHQHSYLLFPLSPGSSLTLTACPFTLLYSVSLPAQIRNLFRLLLVPRRPRPSSLPWFGPGLSQVPSTVVPARLNHIFRYLPHSHGCRQKQFSLIQ